MRRALFAFCATAACGEIAEPTLNLDSLPPVVVATARAAAPPGAPNVVLVVLDDAVYTDLRREFMPVLYSWIVDQGVTFPLAYAAGPLCCPSRAAILRGQTVERTGVLSNNRRHQGGALEFDRNGGAASTVLTDLYQAGWRTGLYGKWMNDVYSGIGLSSWPYRVPGLDAYVIFRDLNYYGYGTVEKLVHGSATAPAKYGQTPADYSTTRMGNRALQFLRAVPSGAPFFLTYAPYAPHANAVAAPGDKGALAGCCDTRPPSYWLRRTDPPRWLTAPPRAAGDSALADSLYQRMPEALRHVDRYLDSIRVVLTQSGRLANTYVILTSDNGYHRGEHGIAMRKASPYEEAVRTPVFVRGPGIPAGVVDSGLVSLSDLAPTILAWVGVSATGRTMSGVSLANRLANPLAPLPCDRLVQNMDPQYPDEQFDLVVTCDRWKYVRYRNGIDEEMFDLSADPYELQNLAREPGLLAALVDFRARLDVLLSGGAP